jgi:hypothetical protein
LTYDVVHPDTPYHGKSYSSLVQDWVNWYVSVDPDKRTFGDVVFLRSTPIPSINRPDGAPTEMTVSSVYTDDPLYDKPYSNNPEVRVGGDKLQIRTDQAIFVPIIASFEFARKPFHDWGSLQESTGLTIDYGDNPPLPSQVKIDGNNINTTLDEFRIRTALFPVIIPEADYGRSLKDFMEESLAPGQYLAIAEGYFVLIRNLSAGLHRIYSRASAPREKGGPYVAELLYELRVEEKPRVESRGAVDFQPPRNQALINRILKEKVVKGEITDVDQTAILGAIGSIKRPTAPRRRVPTKPTRTAAGPK